jgi:putative Mg2+ transporter-C (MgtC) family protein
MVDLANALQWDLLSRVLVAFALGGVIGLERERRAKVAGLRTHMLVAGGSALFTVASYALFVGEGTVHDPGRIAAQIVTGVGFLGGGAILRGGASISGLTTAASIWMAAAVGMVAGGGAYPLAVVSAAVAVGVLRLPRELVRPERLRSVIVSGARPKRSRSRPRRRVPHQWSDRRRIGPPP